MAGAVVAVLAGTSSCSPLSGMFCSGVPAQGRLAGELLTGPGLALLGALFRFVDSEFEVW